MKGSKMYLILLTATLTTLILISNMTEFYAFSFKFYPPLLMSFTNFEISLVTDKTALIFTTMVLMVTTLVTLYSEIYMEHYNNKKFFLLLLFFFSSMMILIHSQSFLSTMIGWDMLGISSMCLIMFYPNHLSLYNTILTMMFNRLGDVILTVVLSLMILDFNNIFSITELNWMLMTMLILCGFTKSAQFPFSTWLPAAMSAPTPISAMVHSSTLVTAGILIMSKFSPIENTKMVMMISMFSLTTYIMGSLMANSEKDMKKVIAFSTMSQISMIMFFLMFNLTLSMTHMLFHALFKTMLFCSAGLMFSINLGTQLKSKISTSSEEKLLKYLTFLSIMMMSGLTFSSSFYSKDTAMEILSSEFNSEKFMIMIMGSLMTLMYCMKLMETSKSSTKLFSFSSMTKFYNNKPLLSMTMIMIFSGSVITPSLFFEDSGKLSMIQTLMITLTLMSVMMKKNNMSFKSLMYFTEMIYFSKKMSSKLYFIMKTSTKKSLINDHFSFKPKFISINKETLKSSKEFSEWTISITMSIIFAKYML